MTTDPGATWQAEFDAWLAPFLARLRRKEQRRWAPVYLRGRIGPGERKSVGPLAARVAPGAVQQLHHFVAASPWATAPLDEELVRAAEQLVRLGREHRLRGRDRPRRAGDEMVQRLDGARRDPLRQRRDALAPARAEQAAQGQGRPSAPWLGAEGVAEGREEGRQPGVERGPPVRIVGQHDPTSRRSPHRQAIIPGTGAVVLVLLRQGHSRR